MAIDPNSGVPVPQAPNTIFPYPTQQQIPSQYPQGYMTPAQIRSMYDYSQALLKKSEEPVPGTRGGWTVGVQHLVDALVGGKQSYDANRGELGARTYDAGSLEPKMGTWATPSANRSEDAPSEKKTALPGGAVSSFSPEGSDLLDRAAAVTAKQESGGKYDHVTTTKNRQGQPQSAIGKYGVMDFNVGPWTKEILGKEMTPQEFLSSPEAQDAVYKGKMGQYIAKHGPEGAGRAWLGGPGGVNNPQRRDPLGTAVGDYGSDFAKALQLAPTDGGEPASFAPGDGRGAIVSALRGGAPAATIGPKAVPGVPVDQVAQGGPETGTYVAPFAFPSRPHYTPEQYRAIMGSPWIDGTVKERVHGEYLQQHQPNAAPYLGGSAIADPNDPNRQFFSPGIHWSEDKDAAGQSRATARTVMPPNMKAKPPVVQPLEEPGGSPGVPGGPISAPPPPLVPRKPITTTPPIAPPIPPGVVPPPAAPMPAKPPEIESTIPQTNKLALNNPGISNDAVNPVMEAAAAAAGKPMPVSMPALGNPPPPAASAGPQSEKPTEGIIGAAQAALASPLGANAAAALGGAPNNKMAESTAEWQRRGIETAVDLERRKALAKSDAEQYTKNLQSYTDIGIRTNKSIPTLEIAHGLTYDPRYYSGLLADPYELIAKGKAGLAQLGIAGDDKAAAAPIEIFNKILSGNIVTELKTLLGGLGQIRLAEINLITNSVANKYNTVAANRAVLNMMQREAAQAKMIGNIAQQYDKGWALSSEGQWVPRQGAQSNTGLQESVNNYVSQNPLFTDDEIKDIQHVFDISKKTPNEKAPAEKVRKDLADAANVPLEGDNTSTPAATQPATPGGVIRYDDQGNRVQ